MKLLIKMYLEDINTNDITQILNAIKYGISEKSDTEIYLMTTDSKFKTSLCKTIFLSSVKIPEIINYSLDQLKWDIVLPITKPIILSRNFDVKLKTMYKNKFKNLEGVLWFNDGDKQGDINTYPIIGRKYFERFGYVYNPAYRKKNYDKEFSEVLKLNKKYYFYNNDIFKVLNLTPEDDNIYNLRKGINFGLIKNN